jgi:cytochrome c
VVNRPIASHEGFGYSGPMKEFSEGGKVVWDFEHLNHFLTVAEGPTSRAPRWASPASRRIDERANAVIAYLRIRSRTARHRCPRLTLLRRSASAPADAARKAPAEGGARVPPPEGGAPLLRLRALPRSRPPLRPPLTKRFVIFDILKKPGSARLFCCLAQT